MFSKETYIQRRNKLKKSVGSGLILLLGNDESPMNYADNGYHFRQDSSFLYFFGLDHPFLAGVLDCDSGEDTIFGNDLTVEDFVWMGPQPTMAKPDVSEAKIAAAVHEIALASGGQIAFPIIATINGQTLHNHYHGNILKDGDMFLLDAGAVENGAHALFFPCGLGHMMGLDAHDMEDLGEVYVGYDG